MNFFVLKPFDKPRWGQAPQLERVLVEKALGSVLGQDVCAECAVPPYDLSLRDGWVVDAHYLGQRTPCGTIENGQGALPMAPHQAYWIHTGGPIPPGGNAVISAYSSEEKARCQLTPPLESHILRQGAEWRVGQRMCAKGTRLGPAHLALLKEAGITHVYCWRAPKVALIATGNELMAAANPQRVASNACYVKALLALSNVPVVYEAVSDDRAAHLAQVLQRAYDVADVVLTTGGTGQGRRDVTRQAIAVAQSALGQRVETPFVPISDTSPFIVDALGDKPVIGLPGHPLAMVMIMQRCVLPLLRARAGYDDAPQTCVATLTEAIEAQHEGELCVSLTYSPQTGERWATPLPKGTGCARLIEKAQGIVTLTGQALAAGQRVEVQLFFASPPSLIQ